MVWFGAPHNLHTASDADRAAYAEHGKKADFYGEIAGLDRAVGQLRSELRKLDIHRNTLFWYCSDDGGLPNLGVTGGRANKGAIYEGGLRVPGIIEWPERIPQLRATNIPACTFDIDPTLLDIVGVQPEHLPPLDGISLVALIDGKMAERPKPLGFWDHPPPGIGTPTAQWMKELLEAQQSGDELGNRERLLLDAAEIKQQYPEDHLPGHSAWLNWPWKLHHIERPNGAVTLNCNTWQTIRSKEHSLLAQQPEGVATMRGELERWLSSVTRGSHGKYYSLHQGRCDMCQ